MVEVCPSDDSWCQDTGPTFVYGEEEEGRRRRRLVGLDWDFNATEVPRRDAIGRVIRIGRSRGIS